MKIATWNVNSVKARLPLLTRWLDQAKPDVALLQEIKCVDADFPRLELSGLGYQVELVGQKTYNGVAILSRLPLTVTERALPEAHAAGLDRAPDQSPGPEAEQLRLADDRMLAEGLAALPAEYREALVLRELEGMPYREIALVTGVPIGTVMSRLSRGRKRLGEALKEKTVGMP